MNLDRNNYIPINIKKGDKIETWYLDISNLSLHELILLKHEIHGTDEISMRALDYTIYDRVGYSSTDRKTLKTEYKMEVEKKRKKLKKHRRYR